MSNVNANVLAGMVLHHMVVMALVWSDSWLGFAGGSLCESVCCILDSPTDVHLDFCPELRLEYDCASPASQLRCREIMIAR